MRTVASPGARLVESPPRMAPLQPASRLMQPPRWRFWCVPYWPWPRGRLAAFGIGKSTLQRQGGDDLGQPTRSWGLNVDHRAWGSRRIGVACWKL